MFNYIFVWLFVCNICGKGFCLLFILCRYKIIYMKEKLYKCYVCEKVFNCLLILKMYVCIYSDEKEFICE